MTAVEICNATHLSTLYVYSFSVNLCNTRVVVACFIWICVNVPITAILAVELYC
jgi:hypothetical protein